MTINYLPIDFLQKLQKQPESVRKLIFWGTIIAIGCLLFFLWFKSLEGRLKIFREKEFLLPSLKEQLKEMPEIQIPKIKMPEIENLEP